MVRSLSVEVARADHQAGQVQQGVGVGPRVLQAFERLMGLVLVAVAVEMLLRAIKSLAQQL